MPAVSSDAEALPLGKTEYGRARVLFLSQCLPYPPFSGVTRRTLNIITQIARDFDVRLLPFFRFNHQSDHEAVEAAAHALEDLVDEVLEPVPVSSEVSKWHFAYTHMRSVLTHRPYTYYDYGSTHFGDQLAAELREFKPDLVHLDSMDLYRWLDEIGDVPTTCTHHSIESELLKLRAARLRNRVVRAYAMWQARRIEEVERLYAPQVTLNLMMSALDARRLEDLAPGSRTEVVPNGVDAEAFSPSPTERSTTSSVVFVGPLYMYPNWDGIKAFIDESWPIIRRHEPKATLTLVGRASHEQTAELEANEGVQVLGFVPDIRPHLQRARCCVAPLRIGGGTRLKILEYWAMEKPVVSTSIGCEGLSTIDGVNVFIRDQPEEFAEAVLSLLSDQPLADAMGKKARETVEAEFTWDRIGKKLRQTYRELIAS